jgi:CheY-like chemotaxis protein
MVVEDDSDVRETIVELLEDEGYEARAATNGQDALEMLRGARAPGLILLDLRMPVMDGWEFRRQQRGDPTLSQIPVVVMSADGALERKTEGMAAAAVLAKPVGLERLLETVHRFC